MYVVLLKNTKHVLYVINSTKLEEKYQARVICNKFNETWGKKPWEWYNPQLSQSHLNNIVCSPFKFSIYFKYMQKTRLYRLYPLELTHLFLTEMGQVYQGWGEGEGKVDACLQIMDSPPLPPTYPCYKQVSLFFIYYNSNI